MGIDPDFSMTENGVRSMHFHPLAVKLALAPFAVFMIVMAVFFYLKNRNQ